MLIGKEVLPSVYISNINIFDNLVELVVFCVDSTGTPTWSKKKNLKDQLELKIIAINNNTELASDITSGITKFGKLSDNAQTFLASTMDTVDITAEGSLFFNHTIFYKKIMFKIDSETENMTLFANLFIESINIEGPTASENIISQFGAVNQSMSFFKNKLQYYGAVHQHENRFMEGAFHTERAHSFIESRTVPNYKIKDFRNIHYPTSEQKKITKVPQISELFVSFDEDTNHNFSFFIDLKNIMINDTKYGKLLADSGDILNLILRDFLFSTLTIHRDKIKVYNKTTATAGVKKDASDVIESSMVLYATENFKGNFNILQGENIKSIKQTFDSSLVALNFSDDIDFSTFGDFQYRMEFSFSDPTIRKVEQINLDLFKAIELLSSYRDLLVSGNNYNYSLDKPNQSFEISSARLSAAFLATPKQYVDLKSILHTMTEQEQDADIYKYFNLINPKSCTVQSVNKFISDFGNLINKFHDQFDINFNTVKGNRDQKAHPKSHSNINRITKFFKFQEVVTPSESINRYSFSAPEATAEDNPRQRFTNTAVGALFGNTKMNFGLGADKKKFKDMLNKNSKNKRGRQNYSVVSLLDISLPLLPEEHSLASEYLGKESKFLDFDSLGEEKTVKTQSELSIEVESIINTNKAVVEDEAEQVKGELQILVGFEKTEDGNYLMKKPIFEAYEEQTVNGETLLRQMPVQDNDESFNFPYINEYSIVSVGSPGGTVYELRKNPILEVYDDEYEIDIQLFTNNPVTNPSSEIEVSDLSPPNPQTNIPSTNADTRVPTTTTEPTYQNNAGITVIGENY